MSWLSTNLLPVARQWPQQCSETITLIWYHVMSYCHRYLQFLKRILFENMDDKMTSFYISLSKIVKTVFMIIILILQMSYLNPLDSSTQSTKKIKIKIKTKSLLWVCTDGRGHTFSHAKHLPYLVIIENKGRVRPRFLHSKDCKG